MMTEKSQGLLKFKRVIQNYGLKTDQSEIITSHPLVCRYFELICHIVILELRQNTTPFKIANKIINDGSIKKLKKDIHDNPEDWEFLWGLFED